MLDFRWLRDIWQGKRTLGPTVERVTALPITGDLFTVSGGRILITSIIGELTAACDANATSAKLVSTPTVGTVTDLCTATNIASYAIGDEIGITGLPTDALQPDAGTAGSIPGQTVGVVVKAGTIGLNIAAPGQVTGRIRWTLHYLLLDAAASVAPA